jgi:hypothetical protein
MLEAGRQVFVRTHDAEHAVALASRCTYTALAHRALETAKQSRKDKKVGATKALE